MVSFLSHFWNATPLKYKRDAVLFGHYRYFRPLIPHSSEIVTPIVDLTKNCRRFRWSTVCQSAFELLMDRLAKLPLLSRSDLQTPFNLFNLTTYVFNDVIGACLVQTVISHCGRPIALSVTKAAPAPNKVGHLRERSLYSSPRQSCIFWRIDLFQSKRITDPCGGWIIDTQQSGDF